MEMEQLRNDLKAGHIFGETGEMAPVTQIGVTGGRCPHLVVALSQFGVEEIVGDKHNAVIVEYFHDIGHEWVKDDETAWCSAFINWVMNQAGKPMSGELNARSWMDVGEPVSEPKIGDVTVLWRDSPDSWKGHVGLFIRKTPTHVYLLGGNQSNSVNIQAYPVNRVLGYRKV